MQLYICGSCSYDWNPVWLYAYKHPNILIWWIGPANALEMRYVIGYGFKEN